MAERKIRRITQTIPSLPQISKQVSKRKVAAYARVSTSSAEQENSLAAQRDYFYKLILRHDDWCFVEVYYDDGISGLSSRRRDGFNRMLDDAKAGKIDLILTKSLSRFARNTVDSLIAIRTLKSLGVEVYFEKEDIFTFDAKGEFLITLMSSLAQEESRSLSENVTWGHRKRFADGKYYVPYARFIGYDRGSDGIPIINPNQEPIIRLIFRLYLLGESELAIRKFLEYHNNSLGAANTSRWHDSRIMDILENEKYKGDALLQKRFTTDYLTKKVKINEGELPQYYVHEGHKAIIPPTIFDMVSDERKRRLALKRRFSCTSAMSSRIICAECNNFYGAKSAHSNDRYRRIFWRCTCYYDGNKHSPRIMDSALRNAFATILASQISQNPHILETCGALLTETKGYAITEYDIDAYVSGNNQPLFDYWLLRTLVDKIIVLPDKHIELYLSNGQVYDFV